MDSIALLHNAARHYCAERSGLWRRQRDELVARGGHRLTIRSEDRTYTDEFQGIFPRFLILDAFQHDVECFVPTEFGTIEELRSILIEIGGSACTELLAKETNPIALDAIADERGKFIEFVQHSTDEQSAQAPTLPFRKVLGDPEHRALQKAFVARWGNWYGGGVDAAGIQAALEAVTLHVEAMRDPGSYDGLRELLASHGVSRLFELREWGDGYELDLPAASFTYNGAEGFWTTHGMQWMVYASHEASITFGGSWLIEGMRQRLPLFDHYIYRGWDLALYAPPPATGP